jgi:small membrane protein
MSFFQILITISVFLVLALISRSRDLIAQRFFTIVITLAGIYFVVFPNDASKIAHLVGIGRGADLIFYLFIIFSWFWFASTSAKMRKMEKRLTEIVRAMAIANPIISNSKKKDD